MFGLGFSGERGKGKRKVDGSIGSDDLICFVYISFSSLDPSLNPWSKYSVNLTI